MFRIKICGVVGETDVDDAAAAGADAVGLNFHPPSIRFVNQDVAGRLATHARDSGLKPIGVFVKQTPDEIAATAHQLGLWAVQLHGDQQLDEAKPLLGQGLRVIRAIRLPPGPLPSDHLDQQVQPWIDCGCWPLLDAEVGAAGGGQGVRLDWASIGRWAKSPSLVSQPGAQANWALAGGLTPEVVGEAISRSGARALDVASGVEEPRGQKSRAKVFAFTTAAKGAWNALR